MSIEAVSYALNLGLGDATRKLVLIGYANHAAKDGTGAYPSTKTVSEYACCSERTVQRHVVWLIENGYMSEGDQALVDHYDRRRRPIVYDVAMSPEQVEQWAADARPGRRDVFAEGGAKGGAKAAENLRGDKMTPLSVVGAPDQDPNILGCQIVTPHLGVTNDHFRGDTALSPKPSLNRPEEQHPLTTFGGGPPNSNEQPPATARRNGTRLSPDWQPPPGAVEWARLNVDPRVDIDRETEKFRDYWCPKAGKDAVKLDWTGTWRNWIRKTEDDLRRYDRPRPIRPEPGNLHRDRPDQTGTDTWSWA